ncbi:MAG: aspartate carbamoyltransferase regulatory subunit [Candidatus Heimdallarchaeota archaeon]|nr:MAG: aspartate carbamoyltransferase regulatory subunit [Candidatus Heimdallarchaeota archaeon]
MSNKNSNNKELIVAKIDNGVVIDHITPPGRAFYALKVLKIDEKYPHSAFVALNVPSKKLGRKDVLKIRNIDEKDLNIEVLGLIISGSNVAYIKDYHIVKKEKIITPKKATGILNCPSSTCITNQREDVETQFVVITSKDVIKLRCEYCDIIFNIHERISLLR